MSTITSILPPPTRPDRPTRSTEHDAESFALPEAQSQRPAETKTADTQPKASHSEDTPEPETQNTTQDTAAPDKKASENESNAQPTKGTDISVAPPATSSTPQVLATAAQALAATQEQQTVQATNQQTPNVAVSQNTPSLSTTATLATEPAALATATQLQSAQQLQSATPTEAQQQPAPVTQQTNATTTNLSSTTTDNTQLAATATSTNQQASDEGDADQNNGKDGRFRSFAAAERSAARTDAETPQPTTKAADLADQLLKKLADAPSSSKQIDASTPQRLNAEPEQGVNEARLNRGLRSAVNQQGGNVTLRLTPPELGTVRIQMELRGTTVSATLHAETDAGRQVLAQDISRLRAGLESQGLSVDRLSVQGMSQSNASNTSEDPLNQRDARDPGQQQQSQNRSRNDQQNNNAPDDFQNVFESSEPQPRPSLRSL
ncbi:MAG: flagellar hook-length control protein FliK [Phycisphaeraceae bacterium]